MPQSAQAEVLRKRKYCYVQKPAIFDISPCECGCDATWSEFEKHLWCEQCGKDFIPKRWGIFEGPIMIETANMMGIRFDRLNLESRKIERFDLETKTYIVEAPSQQLELACT